MQTSTKRTRRLGLAAGAALCALVAACAGMGMGMGKKSDLGFFVTSTGPGKGVVGQP